MGRTAAGRKQTRKARPRGLSACCAAGTGALRRRDAFQRTGAASIRATAATIAVSVLYAPQFSEKSASRGEPSRLCRPVEYTVLIFQIEVFASQKLHLKHWLQRCPCRRMFVWEFCVFGKRASCLRMDNLSPTNMGKLMRSVH